jgi:acetyl-CoA C-acetyltransferase
VINRKIDPRSPVIAGTGQVTATYPAAEPVALLAEALRAAATPRALDSLDSLEVVAIGTRPYTNPGGLVARELGISVGNIAYTTHGGHSPQALVNRAAWDIWTGKRSAVAVGGAESWRTRRLLRREGRPTGWTVQDPSDRPDEVIGSELSMATAVEAALGFGDPLDAYPMLESALRHEAGRSLSEHDEVIARLWADFSAVAAANPYAAIRRSVTPGEILSPEGGNRLISHPYRKLAVANNDVDQAAAVIVTSYERALALGFPRDELVFVHGFGEAVDCDSFTARRSYTTSAAIEAAADDALRMAAVTMDDIGSVDIYSCFPSAVQVAARALGLPLSGALTVTGGLTFAGGPWNNYVTHSIATMAARLREQPTTLGMCTANGGLLTKHAIGIYGATPPDRPLTAPRVRRLDDERAVVAEFDGPVTIAAATVRYGRDDSPSHGFAVADTPAGERILLRVDQQPLLAELESREVVGRTGTAAGSRMIDLADDRRTA